MNRPLRLIAALSSALLLSACQAAGPAGLWQDISGNRASTVQAQLRAGGDPNAVNAQGQPAIMQAIRDGAWDVYDVLAKDPRTKVNATNKHQETPLMYLAVTGETKRAQALIRRGAQVNRLGWTPLQYAASTGKLDTVKMLVANKALVNAPAPDGTTALMMAARAGDEQVANYLLGAGADVTMRNLEKMDAADWAKLKGHDALAQQLAQRSQRVMAQRDAQRRANAAINTQTGARSQDRLIPGTGVNPGAGWDTPAAPPVSAAPDAAAAAAAGASRQASPSQPAGGSNASGSGSPGSGSGYFDLDRFNR